MSAATHNSYDAGLPPSRRIVEPLATAGGHLAPGASAPAAPGVLSGKPLPFYSAEDVATIHRMRRDGATWQQVADAIGRNKKAVEMAARRLGAIGIGAATWTAQQIETLKALVDAGNTQRVIAGKLNRSLRAVQAKMSELYIRPKRIHRKIVGTPPPLVLAKRQRAAVLITKPQPDIAPAVKERRCLCGCNRMFLSHGPGNRIRPECLGTYDHRHTGAV